MTGTGAPPGRDGLSSLSPTIVPIPVEEIPDQVEPSSPPRATALVPYLRPMPSHHVAKYLFSSEKFVGEWRRHWIKVIFWVLAGFSLPFAFGFAAGMARPFGNVAVAAVVIVMVFAQLVVGWNVWEWWDERFVLTNKRVMLITGLLSRRVAMMPLARVTDMAYVQSPLGMALNYGSFVLESAGQDQALSTIKPLPHPRELYLLFCQEMYDPDAVSDGEIANSPEYDHDEY